MFIPTLTHSRYSIDCTQHQICVGTDIQGSNGGWLLRRQRNGWGGVSWRMVRHWCQCLYSRTQDEFCQPLTKIGQKWSIISGRHREIGDKWWIFSGDRGQIGGLRVYFMCKFCKLFFFLGWKRGWWLLVWIRLSWDSITGRYGGWRAWSPNINCVGHRYIHPFGQRWWRCDYMISGFILPADRTQSHNTLWLVLSWTCVWWRSGGR